MAKLYAFPKTNQKKSSCDHTTDASIADALSAITDRLVAISKALDACESRRGREILISALTQCASELRYIALNARGFRL